MIRLLMWLLLIYIGYRIVRYLVTGKKQENIRESDSSKAAVTHQDPVCGMYVSEEDAIIGRVADQRHYFCSMTCLEKYREQLDQPHNS